MIEPTTSCTGHTQIYEYCTTCGKPSIDMGPSPHEFSGGVCQCGLTVAQLTHGDTKYIAEDSSTHVEVCIDCSTIVGSSTPHNSDYQYNENEHWPYCETCGLTRYQASDSHSFGDWYGTSPRARDCTVCGYTEYCDHEGYETEDDTFRQNPTCGEDGYVDIVCSNCGNFIRTQTLYATGQHKGGTATCKDKAKCAVCGNDYGELAAHTPNTDDGDCTTAITCSVCGEVTTPANTSHTGGTATCKEKAKCSVCGTSYGELAAHTPDEVDDSDCTADTLCKVCGKVAIKGAEAHTEVTDNAKQADCYNTGLTEGKHCTVCGTATVPQQIVPITHTWANATCISPKTCRICGETEGNLDPNAHEFDDSLAPCECLVCGNYFHDGSYTAHEGQCGKCGAWPD